MTDTSSPLVDVAVIGGSFAGLTAALQLTRGRRRVVVYDHGLTRNRFASEAHGFLGLDGKSPDEIRAAGRRDLLAYPSAEVREERVASIERDGDTFRIGADRPLRARRVILASGMRDLLPDIPGLAEAWGKTAIQCPYCHGYELADRPTGLLAAGHPHVADFAPHLLDWTRDIVVFENGTPLLCETAAKLDRFGIRVEPAAIASLDAPGGALRSVVLADGRRIERTALYLVPRSEPASDLARTLGCRFVEGPMGPYVETTFGATSVPGVYAAGDLARPVFGAVDAAASGVAAAVGCHRSLTSEGLVAA